MQDRRLYAEILRIQALWLVDRVGLKLSDGEVHVDLQHHQVEQWPCPECGEACRQYDHQPERQGRHLDTCQYWTILHVQPPRAECDQQGVGVVKLSRAERSSRFPALFERLTIEWRTAASQKAVGERLGLSWDEIHDIMERAVERGREGRQAEKLPALGVHEKALRKVQKYLTLVNDLEQSRGL